MRFLSDNTAPICPEVLEAIHAADRGLERAYGDDAWTARFVVSWNQPEADVSALCEPLVDTAAP